MGTKPNKAAIGAFIVAAIVLLVAVVLIFGAGRFFTKEYTFITYLSGSVKGLSVGSPVMFRGVKVGSVTDIRIIVNPAVHGLTIPVAFTLEPGKFEGIPVQLEKDPRLIQKIVKEYGLRTQLQLMSLLTGQLMLALDFFPNKPAQYVGLSKKYPEIPSVPTPLEELQRAIGQLPLREMLSNLTKTLTGIDRVLKSAEAKKTFRDVEGTIRDVRNLVQRVNERIDPLMESLTRSAGAAEATLAETKETVAVARGGIKEVVASTRGTLESAQATLKQSEQTLQSFSGDSRMAGQLNQTLRELAATARSLRQLSDYLERHPESLIRGKRKIEGD